MNPILVTSYVNPDLDGIASIVAYTEFLNKQGKTVVGGIFGRPQDEAKFVLDRFHFEYLQQLESSKEFDEIILVDVSELNTLEGKIPPEKVIEVIDHRKLAEVENFPKAKVQNELVGACATLIAEKFKERNVELSKKSAVLLYAAIVSNTLNFKGGVTTDRDKEMAAWLNEFAAMPSDFTREMFLAKSELSGIKLSERIIDDFLVREIVDEKVGVGQIEMIGAKELVENRSGEIFQELQKLEKEFSLDLVFLNIIDLEKGFNIIISHSAKTERLLESILPIKFENGVARTTKIFMRKEITPLIKAALEK